MTRTVLNSPCHWLFMTSYFAFEKCENCTLKHKTVRHWKKHISHLSLHLILTFFFSSFRDYTPLCQLCKRFGINGPVFILLPFLKRAISAKTQTLSLFFNDKQTTVEAGLIDKSSCCQQLLEHMCVFWWRSVCGWWGCEGWSVHGGSCRKGHTLCFLRALIRTNVPQNHDPSNLPQRDKDGVMKIGLGQEVLRLGGSSWQNTAMVSTRWVVSAP